MQKRFGLSAFWIKLAMAGLMVLDHLRQFLWLGPEWWHSASRAVAPVFAFFVAEGMCQTRSRAAYILRVAGFGVIMRLVNWLLGLALGVYIPNNIFLPLATGAAVVACVDAALKGGHVPLYMSLSVLLVYAAQSFMEGGALVPLMILIFYYLRNKLVLMYMCFILFASLLCFAQYFAAGRFSSQYFIVLAVPVIMLYNGERGPDSFAAKYFFYFFFPLHIWLIAIITALN